MSTHLISITPAALPRFRRSLLTWYRREKRDLEWRSTRDPYAIWISEIMLQQTRVAAVVPYYRRFLARFPTVRHLARAKQEVVLRHWAGLGYYSRARNLHSAAQEIVMRHDGIFPSDLGAALALPGIGSYTAAAVLSIAYGKPHAVVDGNVARVLARLGAVRGDLRQPRTWRDLASTAEMLLDSRTASDWNQAMMELGATVCTPLSPRCEACPVSPWCRAHALGLADEIPAPRAKPKTQKLTLAAAVLLDPQGRTLLVRQTNEHSALFSRMWQFPAVKAGRNPRKDLAAHLSRIAAESSTEPREALFSVDPSQMERLEPARHTVTFRAIRLAPFLLRVERLPQIEGSRALPLTELDRLPVSSATKKIAASALRSV